ncbi:MAG: AAA family ATPase [Bacteroidales bacterium]|nr:AAA family ATPase [Bacteroidales bacterium]
MEGLVVKSRQKIKSTGTGFVRYLMDRINWNDRLIGIKGARGVGKTTLVLQYLKLHLSPQEVPLYISLDDLYFSANRLYDLASEFFNHGGTHLVIDEVHRYPAWAQEIKLIYDDYPALKVVFTGSSMLTIHKAKADLSRRVAMYTLKGLSLREYLNFTQQLHLPPVDLQTVFKDHESIADEVNSKLRILPPFHDYTRSGYYPFFMESAHNYHARISEVISTVLDSDLTFTVNIKPEAIGKLKKLLYIVSHSVPFKPNVSKLSELTGISRNALITYLNYLERATVLNLLHTEDSGIGYLRKPEKVFLENPNLLYALTNREPDRGNIRETFFFNQLNDLHRLSFGKKGDFFVDGKYTIEVGGKDKTLKQIAGMPEAFIASDNIPTGFQNRIPLWLFGFLY